MNVEQIARDYVTKMSDPEKIRAYLTADAMVSGGILPQPISGVEGLSILSAFTNAIPDITFDVGQVTVNGNEATVQLQWGGTHAAPLSLPMSGWPTIPPTGNKVWVNDTYVLKVQGEKVSYMRLESPADGGIPGALGQMGAKMPGM